MDKNQPPDIDEIKAKVEARVQQVKNDAGADKQPPNLDEIPVKFILDCLEMGPLGDGILYARANEGEKIYNATIGAWFTREGHRLAYDYESKSLAAVEKNTDLLTKAASVLTLEIAQAAKNDDSETEKSLRQKQKKIFKQIKRLQTERGRKEARHFAHTNNVWNLSTLGKEFDSKPWLFPCGNGVIDLKTAELRDGRPDDYLTRGTDVPFLGIDEPCPTWTATLYEIFSGNEKLIAFIQRLFGYAITGLTTEHIVPVFWGAGRNGKGTIVKAAGKVLQELAAPVPAEILLDQGRIRSSAAPSPDIMALKGLRLAFCSESDEGRKFSSSKFKWLSGGDELVGRNPHDIHPTQFQPSHLIILLTNKKPKTPANDFAFWERMKLIRFPLRFVNRDPETEQERRADNALDFKLDKELPGILAWMVQGCIYWQEQGLDPPKSVTDETNKYRREEDNLAEFLEDCCYQDDEAHVFVSDIFPIFRRWWASAFGPKWIPGTKKFGTWMSERFEKGKDSRTSTVFYIGVDLLDGISAKYPEDPQNN